jgi:hypothetical protein
MLLAAFAAEASPSRPTPSRIQALTLSEHHRRNRYLTQDDLGNGASRGIRTPTSVRLVSRSPGRPERALSILLGYKAKIGGWLIAIFPIGVTPMHKFWGISDPMMQQVQMVMFMKNLAMLGGAPSYFSVRFRSLEPRLPQVTGSRPTCGAAAAVTDARFSWSDRRRARL